MAQVDTSIYGNLLRPAPTVMDNVNALDAADLQRTQLAGAKVNLIGQQQSMADQQAVRALYQRPGFDPSTPEGLSALGQASPSTYLATQKAILDNRKTQADTTLANSNSDKALQEAQKLKTQHAIDVQAQIAQAAGSATDQASWDRGLQIAQTLGADISKVPKVFDPATAKQIHDQALTGAQQLDAHFKQITADETARHNRADEVNSRYATDTSAKNSAATITKDYAVAGIGPNGAPTSDRQATVTAIGEGRMAPPTLQALRNPRMAAIMDDVNSQFPHFDATVYGTRQKAMKDFGTGPQGQQVQAANTALNHLSTLEQLAQAQANGNIPLFNQLANAWGKQTGNSVPSNLQGAITLVGPEISKAVVGAGGTGGDRDKVDKALEAITKGSPAQQAGQIGTMKDIFGGRLSEVGRTYQRSTHLDNFTDMLSPAAQQIYAAKHGPSAATANPADAGLHAAAEAILKGTK